ncbi:MAG TPA: hypothetical protein VN258_20160 [Mobilitalea sp.]|nr:hypothetical protein [Mobilitalea sp.]
MNNSKKLKMKKVKKDRLIEKKSITKMSKPWIIASSILVVILVGALLFDQLYESTLLTINGEKYKLSDLSYYFYNVESQYNYYDQMFGGTGSYWDMTYDQTSGTTVREQARTDAINAATYNEILYKQALSEGYSLTADEKSTVSTNVDSLLKDKLTAAVKKKNNYTKAYLSNIISKTTLVSRYRQDKIDALNIDDAAIKAGVNYDDYRQYDIEYLFISTKTTDDSGNSVDMTADEKTAAYNKIKGIYDSAKTTTDWSTLIPATETELTYQSSNFTPSSTTFSDDFKKMMEGMESGAISDIYEDTTGYYIVKMTNNNSSESYDTAVKDAISSKESEEFLKAYDDIKAKYDVKVNDKALKKLTMGTVTLAN